MKDTVLMLGLAAGALSAATATAQTQDLLFTTRRGEATRAPLTDALHRVEPQDVMVVTPEPALGFTAEKHTPHDAFLAMVGDHDLDAVNYEATLWTRIDAIMARPSSTGPTSREIYVSPSADTTSALSGYSTAQMGDVVRIGFMGQFEPFLNEQRVDAVFNIAEPRLNVDAVAYDPTPSSGPLPGPGPEGMIYLSLEDDHEMDVWCSGTSSRVMVEDGAIIAVQVLGFDGLGAVLGRGALVASESEVGAWVVASGIADQDGGPVREIGDLDGLSLDFKAGLPPMFSSSCGRFPHLMFSGEKLTGAGVVSTHFGGTVARLNGAPLGSPVLSNGSRLGLFPVANTLNGLHVSAPVCRFTTETPTPFVFSGDTMTVDVGGAVPGAPLFMLLSDSLIACPVGGIPTMAPWLNPCFPDLILPIANSFALPPAGADGTQQFTWPVGLLPADFCLTFQAVNVVPGPTSSTIHLSTPLTIRLRP
ncbi:MAG: hypothetical protein AAF628_37775 [Planctomycetota bacterium]